MKNNKFYKMFWHDFMEGIWKRKEIFFLPFFLVIIACIKLHNNIMSDIELSLYSGSTVMDYWIYIIQGKNPYHFNLETLYEIPTIWVTLYAFLFILLNAYPVNDIQQWGYQMITRSKSRWQWWSAKCAWCILSVIIYFFVCMLAVTIYAVCNGASFSLRPSKYIMETYCLSTFLKCSNVRLLIITLLLPIILSVLLGIVQMILSLRVNPMLSFGVIFASILLAAYKQSWLLIGNIGMPYRIDRINPDGLNSNVAVIVGIVGVVICVIVGYHIFKRQDILDK